MLTDSRDDKACQIRNLGGLRMISHEIILADLIAAKTIESSVRAEYRKNQQHDIIGSSR